MRCSCMIDDTIGSSRAGYAFMSTLRFLARKTDHVTVVAYQSEPRLANADTDQGLQSAPSSVPVLTDEHMQPYKEVRPTTRACSAIDARDCLAGPRVRAVAPRLRHCPRTRLHLSVKAAAQHNVVASRRGPFNLYCPAIRASKANA